MLLAAAAMVLSVVDGRSGCSVVRSLGVGFIVHLLSLSVRVPLSRLSRWGDVFSRQNLVLQNE